MEVFVSSLFPLPPLSQRRMLIQYPPFCQVSPPASPRYALLQLPRSFSSLISLLSPSPENFPPASAEEGFSGPFPRPPRFSMLPSSFFFFFLIRDRGTTPRTPPNIKKHVGSFPPFLASAPPKYIFSFPLGSQCSARYIWTRIVSLIPEILIHTNRCFSLLIVVQRAHFLLLFP